MCCNHVCAWESLVYPATVPDIPYSWSRKYKLAVPNQSGWEGVFHSFYHIIFIISLFWKPADIMLTHNKMLQCRFTREHFFIVPLSNVHTFWQVPGVSFLLPWSIFVFKQVCRVLVKILWPICETLFYNMYLYPWCGASWIFLYELVEDHEMIWLSLQSYFSGMFTFSFNQNKNYQLDTWWQHCELQSCLNLFGLRFSTMHTPLHVI